MISQRRVLRLSTVARLVGVTSRTVRYWVASGTIHAHRRGPRLWFVYADDLEAFLVSATDITPGAESRNFGK